MVEKSFRRIKISIFGFTNYEKMKVAVVGATGLVGSVMLKVLEERNFPVSELLPVATAKSVGKELQFRNMPVKVIGMEEAIAARPDIALYSAGGGTSQQWAPEFARVGCTVIDNSSAWRMNPDVPLVVPEINASVIKSYDRIIANPNCSTIQMVMVLSPLHQKYKIKRLVISTYQAVTGTGVKAYQQLENERRGNSGGDMVYPHLIDGNCIPQCDIFLENDYTREEMKMVNEPRKIMSAPEIKITATCVRVPVAIGHSESVNIEFENDFSVEEIKNILSGTIGVIVKDDPATFDYPMPLFAMGKDEVFVGRIRRDESQPNSLNLWIVSDNLRKGAATNAVQIAEYLLKSRKS